VFFSPAQPDLTASDKALQNRALRSDQRQRFLTQINGSMKVPKRAMFAAFVTPPAAFLLTPGEDVVTLTRIL
jgi:hypothetical protein